jgi:hypothetical protein
MCRGLALKKLSGFVVHTTASPSCTVTRDCLVLLTYKYVTPSLSVAAMAPLLLCHLCSQTCGDRSPKPVLLLLPWL